MAIDISKELQEINDGQYGEDIRWPIYRALTKLAGEQLYLYIADNQGKFMISSEGHYIVAKE